MGSRLSSTHRSTPSPAPARVVTADGSLKEFSGPSPAAASDVLGDGSAAWFLCNSDALYFGEGVPALDAGELLRPGQIYFVLPAAMLGRPLSSAEMAALAVKASAALAAAAKSRRRRRGGKTVRVMPVRDESWGDVVNEKLNQSTLGEFAGAASLARRAEAAARPPAMKRALSSIKEDAE